MGKPNNEWTNEELQKLIEGIEIYGESWQNVAAYVGNGKTASQCVAQFIKLPIDDYVPNDHCEGNQDDPLTTATENNNYSGDIYCDSSSSSPASPSSSSAAAETTAPIRKKEKHNRKRSCFKSPFKYASNPLLTQIKFIEHILGHEGAAISAKAATQALLEKAKARFESESEKHIQKKSKVDSRAEVSTSTEEATDEQQEQGNCRFDGSHNSSISLVSDDAAALLNQPLNKRDVEVGNENSVGYSLNLCASITNSGVMKY